MTQPTQPLDVPDLAPCTRCNQVPEVHYKQADAAAPSWTAAHKLFVGCSCSRRFSLSIPDAHENLTQCRDLVRKVWNVTL